MHHEVYIRSFTDHLFARFIPTFPAAYIFLRSLMSLIRRNPDPSPIAGPSSGSNDKYKLAFERTDSLDTLESDTARNQRGPGHSLEVIYSFFGAQLEKFINRLVVKSGRTPTAVKAQLVGIGVTLTWGREVDGRWERSRTYGDYSMLSAAERKLLKALCKSILRCVK